MKRALILITILLQHVGADELLIGDPAWGAHITLPKAWENDNYMGTWYQGWTADRKVWLSSITFPEMPPNWHKKWLPKHCDTFGVTLTVPDGEIVAVEKQIGQFKAQEYRISASSDGEPVEVTATVVRLAPKRLLLITVGGSKADCLAHKEKLEEIIKSVRVAAVAQKDAAKKPTK